MKIVRPVPFDSAQGTVVRHTFPERSRRVRGESMRIMAVGEPPFGDKPRRTTASRFEKAAKPGIFTHKIFRYRRLMTQDKTLTGQILSDKKMPDFLNDHSFLVGIGLWSRKVLSFKETLHDYN